MLLNAYDKWKAPKFPKGGWCGGGDAWFGSINSGVELKRQKGIFSISTFIVKQNLQYLNLN
jgi:hypothetical protein